MCRCHEKVQLPHQQRRSQLQPFPSYGKVTHVSPAGAAASAAASGWGSDAAADAAVDAGVVLLASSAGRASSSSAVACLLFFFLDLGAAGRLVTSAGGLLPGAQQGQLIQ